MNFVKAWAAESENQQKPPRPELNILRTFDVNRFKSITPIPMSQTSFGVQVRRAGSSWKAFQSQFQWLKLVSFDTKPMATICLFSF